MLDHLTIHVADLERSRRFYAAALAPLRYEPILQFPDALGFGVRDGAGKSPDPGGDFWIASGAPQPPLPHVAFSAATPALVDAFHAAALAAGGTDNGAPGLRDYHPGYYAAFIRDPDGHNIECVCHDG